jgi:Txe/YoeB family toxin of Txe-Axe toxin-antitoxin module
VDSVRQVVRAEAKKVKKYTSLLQAMQEDPRGLGRVERLKFA